MGLTIDIIILSFIFFSAIRGFYSGLLEQISQVLGLIISISVSFVYTDRFSTIFLEKISFEPRFVYFFTFSFIFSLSLILVRLVFKTIQIVFLNKSNNWMNKLLGAVFGSLKAIIIMTMLIWFFSILPLTKWNSYIREYSKFAKSSNKLKSVIIEFFHWDEKFINTESYFKSITQP